MLPGRTPCDDEPVLLIRWRKRCVGGLFKQKLNSLLEIQAFTGGPNPLYEVEDRKRSDLPSGY